MARVVVLAATLLPIAPRHLAQAARNVLPEPPPRFRGFRGTVDRAFVHPGETLEVRFDQASGARIAERDVVVSIVLRPTNAAPETVVIAGDGDCGRFDPRTCSLASLLCPDVPGCLTASEAGLAVAAANGEAQLRFWFPDHDLGGPLTIAVTPAEAALPSALQTRRCDQSERPDLLACIDVFANTPPVATSVSRLLALPKTKDFKKVCRRDAGDTPHCDGSGPTVRFAVDDQGDVWMPVAWRTILRPKGQGFDRRQVRGSSAITPFKGTGGPLYIPSAAFLESLSKVGTGFSTTPRFIPEQRGDRLNETTLFGTADKGDSVLHFRRRRPWDHVCSAGSNAGQACEPDPQDQTDKEDCPGATCVTQARARPVRVP